MVTKTLKRNGGVRRRQARISRRKRGVFRDYLLVQTDDRFGVTPAPLRLRACVEVKIVGFDTRFIARDAIYRSGRKFSATVEWTEEDLSVTR